MYTTLEGFFATYGHEREGTLKLLKELTDKSLSQSVANDHRTLGRIAWHITTTYPEMMEHAGIPLKLLKGDAPLPKSAAAIADAYDKITGEMVDFIKKNWTDATLKETKNFYGMDWQLGLCLDILVRHEVHHRGQMTVLMRQAGLKVPGVYGPSRDEWAAMGKQPPTV
jgi:uncharacterized damage-inducible protein DinB